MKDNATEIVMLAGLVGFGLGFAAHAMSGTHWPVFIGFASIVTFGLMGLLVRHS